MSVFGDEISPNLDEQLTLLKSIGVHYLEFRGAWDGANFIRSGEPHPYLVNGRGEVKGSEGCYTQ
jgi:hypothetical protein